MKLPFLNSRRTRIAITPLGVEDLAYLLDRIEEIYAEATGERLSSADFYDRYRAGGIDSPFAMGWATYYDAYRRRAHAPGEAAQRAMEALPPVSALAIA